LRKMGHITVTGDTVEQCLETATAARALVSA
jgi:phosphoribosylaminoimidazole carboxylase (NCAIR synthetase)